jgi:hypothetical protein
MPQTAVALQSAVNAARAKAQLMDDYIAQSVTALVAPSQQREAQQRPSSSSPPLHSQRLPTIASLNPFKLAPSAPLNPLSSILHDPSSAPSVPIAQAL